MAKKRLYKAAVIPVTIFSLIFPAGYSYVYAAETAEYEETIDSDPEDSVSENAVLENPVSDTLEDAEEPESEPEALDDMLTVESIDPDEEELDEDPDEDLDEDSDEDDPERLGNPDASGYCGANGTNLRWEMQDGTLTIFGKGKMKNYGETPAPWISQELEPVKVVVRKALLPSASVLLKTGFGNTCRI